MYAKIKDKGIPVLIDGGNIVTIEIDDIFKPLQKTAKGSMSRNLSSEEIELLTPAGKKIRLRLQNRLQEDSFDFMFRVYAVHLKALDGAFYNELKQDLETIIAFYHLDTVYRTSVMSSPDINASYLAIKTCLEKPLFLHNFTKVFFEVFDKSGNITNLINTKIVGNNRSEKESIDDVNNALFAMALEQDLIGRSKIPNKDREIIEQYQAKLADQLRRLCELEAKIVDPQSAASARPHSLERSTTFRHLPSPETNHSEGSPAFRPTQPLSHERNSSMGSSPLRPIQPLSHGRNSSGGSSPLRPTQPLSHERNSSGGSPSFRPTQASSPERNHSGSPAFRPAQPPAPVERASSERTISFRNSPLVASRNLPSVSSGNSPILESRHSLSSPLEADSSRKTLFRNPFKAMPNIFHSKPPATAPKEASPEWLVEFSALKKCIQDTNKNLNEILKDSVLGDMRESKIEPAELREAKITQAVNDYIAKYVALVEKVKIPGLDPTLFYELQTVLSENIQDLVVAETHLRNQFASQLGSQKEKLEVLKQQIQRSEPTLFKTESQDNKLLVSIISQIQGYVTSALTNLPQVTALQRFIEAFTEQCVQFDRELNQLNHDRPIIVNEIKAIIAVFFPPPTEITREENEVTPAMQNASV